MSSGTKIITYAELKELDLVIMPDGLTIEAWRVSFIDSNGIEMVQVEWRNGETSTHFPNNQIVRHCHDWESCGPEPTAETTSLQLANLIVTRSIEDLSGRKGFDHWWDGIDDDIQDEIRDELAFIAKTAIDDWIDESLPKTVDENGA